MRVKTIGIVAGGVLALASAGAALLEVGSAAAQSQPTTQAQPAISKQVPISSHDRVYTADQTSNTVTVLDPSTDKVLGTITLGAQRLSNTLNPQYLADENVHGLAFSADHRKLAVVSIGSDTVDIIDTASNKVLNHTDVGRASHEGWFTRDGKQFWVADRGRDTVTIVDALQGGVMTDLHVGANPSKVVMSPDGKWAYVNHLTDAEVTVVDVASHRIVDHIMGLGDVFSSDLAISPDGTELWVPHKRAGLTTVVDLLHRRVKTVLKTGADTNHPNFAGQYAYVTVGGLDKTLVYKRSAGNPTQVAAIQDNGHAPHGLWPSGDGSRLYIGLEKSDAVDVVNTTTNKVIDTIAVGEEPQAVVYVPDASPDGSSPNLGSQGLGQQAHNVPTTLPDGTAGDTMDTVKGRAFEATIRPVAGLDMIDLQARGLQPSTTYQAYSVAGDGRRTKVVTFVTDANGNAPQVLAFAQFDGTSVAITPTGGTDRPVSTSDGMHATTVADLFFCDCCC